MCRLYGFRATEPTKIECTLVHAQNALIVQSYRDHSGTSHLSGWGLALYHGGRLQAVRQAKAAVDDSGFRRAAGRAYSETVLAHVRRATVGRVALENTHPFCHGRWAFVHNGTLKHFDELRPKMLAMMTPQHRAAIQGETDSEHIFHMLLSAHEFGSGSAAGRNTSPSPRADRCLVPPNRFRRPDRAEHPSDRWRAAGRLPLGAHAALRRAFRGS